jgi:hypothetical protein
VRRTPHGGSGTGHGHVEEVELLTLEKNGHFPDESRCKNKRRTNSLCKLEDVLVITGIKEITLEGRLL